MISIPTVVPSASSHVHKQRQIGLAVPSPDGAWQAVSGHTTHTIAIFSVFGERWCTYYGHKDGLYARQGTIQSIVWSPDGELLASASSNGSVQIWTMRGIHVRTVRRAGDQPVKALQWQEGGLQLLYEEHAQVNDA
jgi:WD40 repeat protein